MRGELHTGVGHQSVAGLDLQQSGGTRILASAAGRPAEHLVTFHRSLATAFSYASPNAAARVNVGFARDFDRYRTALHLHGATQ